MSDIIFSKGGSAYIASKIDEAVKNESRTATISGNWEIESAVAIPSDFTLVLENCHLRMADGSFSNMFINANQLSELGRLHECADKNITIEGRGNVILDGGEYNGLCEGNSLKNGMPPIWKNNLLLFVNVDGFRVTGIKCHNQRWWALNFIYCRNGYIGNIEFKANDTAIDENGNVYHGLKRSKYMDVLVKNADGIDIRQGCHDIVIENIEGFTEDDTIALTALNGRLERAYKVEGLPSDLCNIEIRNVKSAAYCTGVRLLNQGDLKLHDILIDGVQDVSRHSKYTDGGIYAVRVGDTRMYGKRHATADETYNITIKNVYGEGEAAVALAGQMANVTMENVTSAEGTPLLLDER